MLCGRDGILLVTMAHRSPARKLATATEVADSAFFAAPFDLENSSSGALRRRRHGIWPVAADSGLLMDGRGILWHHCHPVQRLTEKGMGHFELVPPLMFKCVSAAGRFAHKVSIGQLHSLSALVLHWEKGIKRSMCHLLH